MSGRRPGTCGEPGPYDAHCTLERMHDHSCYDGGEDVSWNHHQWYDFDLAPHDCGDESCPDAGYRGPPGRESEYESAAPTARDLAEATNISDFLVPGSLVAPTAGSVWANARTEPMTEADVELARTSYEIPVSQVTYETAADELLLRMSMPTRSRMYVDGELIGWFEPEASDDGVVRGLFTPIPLLWGGDQA
jgi:hypothetical protein